MAGRAAEGRAARAPGGIRLGADGARAGPAPPRRRRADRRAALRDFYEFTDFAHFIEVYIAVDSLVRTSRRHRGGRVRGACRPGRAAGPLRRGDRHPGQPPAARASSPTVVAEALARARRRARPSTGSRWAGSTTSPASSGLASGERTIDWVERWAPEGSVGFGLGGPRSASRGRSSPRSSPAPAPSVWRASRTRVRRPGRRRSGTPCACWVRTGSGTASRRRATPR